MNKEQENASVCLSHLMIVFLRVLLSSVVVEKRMFPLLLVLTDIFLPCSYSIPTHVVYIIIIVII